MVGGVALDFDDIDVVGLVYETRVDFDEFAKHLVLVVSPVVAVAFPKHSFSG